MTTPQIPPFEILTNARTTQTLCGLLGLPHAQQPFSVVRLPSSSSDSDAQSNRYQIWLNGETFLLERENPRAKRRRGAAAAAGLSDVKAPMPGTVLKVLVEAGQTLEAKQPVVVMESMKMEMTLSASAAATVDAVQCASGQLVDMNAVLVKLKPIN